MPQHPLTPAPALGNMHNREREMIPRALLWDMLGLALSTLALAGFSTISDRPHVGVPKDGKVVESRSLILEGLDAQSVVIRDIDGTLLLDLPHGGFLTVIQSAMARARLVARVEGNPPMRVVRYDNGRLVAEDPVTGWSAELYAFGNDNKAAFERLLNITK